MLMSMLLMVMVWCVFFFVIVVLRGGIGYIAEVGGNVTHQTYFTGPKPVTKHVEKVVKRMLAPLFALIFRSIYF